MRLESFSLFLDIVVRDQNELLYNHLTESAGNGTKFGGCNPDSVFLRSVATAFSEGHTGKSADYLRELTEIYLEGALVWEI